MIGTNLGAYTIVDSLGKGGMGEVYRGHDPRLKRDVAIKVLPAEFAASAERLARLEREAQLLAALNHPNVATVHGLEQATGGDDAETRFVVMELVEGQTLGEWIEQYGLASSAGAPLEEVLDVALQIARGLEAAHDKGIVHRDLKPANVRITPDRQAKILDFGLAKAFEVEGAPTDLSSELTASPTFDPATRTGVILGTAPYMSPEQVRCKALDKRADNWAFGCVLYEMLTGKRAFAGETVSDTLAAVLKDEPDWAALPASLPPSLGLLLRRCVRRDPIRRLHDIADARIEIEEILDGDLETLEMIGTPSPVVQSVHGTDAGSQVFAVSSRGWLAYVPSGDPRRSRVVWVDRDGREDELPLREGNYVRPRLSPDGTRLAVNEGGDVYVVNLDNHSATRLTFDGAFNPVWSPGGDTVAFRMDRAVGHRPADGGGPIEELSSIDNLEGLSDWSNDLLILSTRHPNTGIDIWTQSSSGDPQQFLATPANERWPRLSPDGNYVAYATDETPGTPNVFVRPFPDTGAIWQISTDGGISPVWSRDGTELFYWHDGALMAVSVDTEDVFSFEGNPRTVVSGPWFGGGGSSGTQYDVHPDGDRFLMIRSDQAPALRRIDVIIGWLDELERRFPRR